MSSSHLTAAVCNTTYKMSNMTCSNAPVLDMTGMNTINRFVQIGPLALISAAKAVHSIHKFYLYYEDSIISCYFMKVGHYVRVYIRVEGPTNNCLICSCTSLRMAWTHMI